MAKTKYRVITDFTDLKDGNKIYRVGEVYPNPVNKKVSEERIEELMTKKSIRSLKPFIEEVEEEKEKKEEKAGE